MIILKKKRRPYGQYTSLRAARADAREECNKYGPYHKVKIFKETDGTFSLNYPYNKKGEHICSIVWGGHILTGGIK